MKNLVLVVLALVGCSVSIGGKKADSGSEAKSEAGEVSPKNAVSYFPRTQCARQRASACSSRESPDECLKALDQACEEEQAAARDEEERQSKCRAELEDQKASEQRRLESEQRVAQLADCEDTKLSPGTYASHDADAMLVKVQVTEKGCAVYEAFNHGTSTMTQTIEAAQGYYDQRFRRDWDCTSRGFLTASGGVNPVQYSGSNCGSIGATIPRSASWKHAGLNLTISDKLVNAVRLSRVSQDVEMAGERPSLWPEGRRMSNDQARAAVAFSPWTPGQPVANIDALYEAPGPTIERTTPRQDWCADLAATRPQQ
jgi:hypothetical protein